MWAFLRTPNYVCMRRDVIWMLQSTINHSMRNACVLDPTFRRKFYHCTKYWSQIIEIATASIDAMSFDLHAVLASPSVNSPNREMKLVTNVQKVLPKYGAYLDNTYNDSKLANKSTKINEMKKNNTPLMGVEALKDKLKEYLVRLLL